LLARDKKVASGTVRYVLLDAIGKAVISADVGDDTLREFLV
jgi:3-dehydroquinate synthetase